MFRSIRRSLLQLHRCKITELRNSPSFHRLLHMCIVGGGPAGFYTAQQLLKFHTPFSFPPLHYSPYVGHKSANVDIYERLPVPYGLVRFGVAPDHPEVKNVIHTFSQTGKNPRVSFLGNVNVGVDVTVDELRAAYSAVIMCYGCDDDKKLGIPGETTKNVISAKEFVGWYNGLPEHKQLEVNLDTDTVVILGQGNVALDMARILLMPVSELAKTDITEYTLDALERNRVKRVFIVGRRGPLQVAFTIKELREMTKLTDVHSCINPDDMTNLYTKIEDLPRPRRRLTQLLHDTAHSSQPRSASREWILRFLRSPTEIITSNDKVSGVKFVVNKLQGEAGKEKAVPTDVNEIIPCGLVLRSIGYKGLGIDDSLSFNHKAGIFNCSNGGHIEDSTNVYCSGWIRRGAEGVILTTMTDAFDVGKQVLADIQSGQLPVLPSAGGKAQILPLLSQRGVQVVSFDGCEKIHDHEVNQGQLMGKVQDKVTDIQEMLEIAAS